MFRSQRFGLKGRLGVRALQGILGTVVLMGDIFGCLSVTQSDALIYILIYFYFFCSSYSFVHAFVLFLFFKQQKIICACFFLF